MKKGSVLKKAVVSLDLGGTDLKSGVVDASGRILHQSVTSSESKSGKEKVFEKILEAVYRETDWALQKNHPVIGVGFGIPGIVSWPQGVVHRSPHFPDWKDFPLRRKLEKYLKLPFVLDNDANMAALGEVWRGAGAPPGAGKGKKNFVLLTLGTGIGGGIILNGRIHHGDSGFAGEFGHIVIEQDGRACRCGGRGCLEMYASATGIRAELLQLSRNPSRPPLTLRGGEKSPPLRVRGGWGELRTPETLYRLALKGNKTAKKIFENFGKALGAGIASIVNALDIETVILGGGLSGAWKAFIGATRSSIAEHIYPTTAKRIRIRRAFLGNNAGLVGAARAVWLGLDRK